MGSAPYSCRDRKGNAGILSTARRTSGEAQENETAKTTTRPRPQGPAARRAAPRPSRGEGFPVLPVAVGAVILAVVIALVAYAVVTTAKAPPSPLSVAKAYGCANSEMLTQTHFHTHLGIYVNGGPTTGQPDPLQSNLGQNVAGTQGFCWLHTHTITGVQDSIIHIEAPFSRSSQGFNLGDWLKVWQLTNADASLSAGTGQRVVVYVNGKLYKGSVMSVPLKSLEDIEIEYLGPGQSPEVPPTYTWPSGFGA